MLLSIITINFNNKQGLQATVDCVLSQSFSDFEYIIIDGGSTDGSQEIIENISDRLTYWISEPDNGIYHAMNKGVQKATGEYCLFINSGDTLVNKYTIKNILENINENAADIIAGNCIVKSETGSYTIVPPTQIKFSYFFTGNTIPHPSTLIRRKLFDTVGLYNEENKIVSDWEFFLIALCKYSFNYSKINLDIAIFNTDGVSLKKENLQIIEKERKSAFSKNFSVFINDYTEFLELKDNNQKKQKIKNTYRTYLKKILRRFYKYNG